jgi:mRNA-degrading endonuclease toxin of MazEF toxin-antitoxin module
MNYEFGDIVLVQFPQSGTSTRKQRPGIVILDIGDADIVIAPVTSQARSHLGDLPVAKLQGTGLVRPSWTRLAKVATLLKTDIKRKLGGASPSDQQQIVATWARLYGDFFFRNQP